MENAFFLAKKIVDKKLSVRQAENLIRVFKTKKILKNISKDANLKQLEFSLKEKIGLDVFIKNRKNNTGSIIFEYNSKSRTPNPTRMMKAYEHASYTMNMIRSIINGGYTNIKNANDWDLEFIKSSDQGKKYHSIINKILKAISFIDAADNDRNKNTQFELHEFYTSHEGLLLDYEQGLTRYDYSEKKYYDYSGHMIWVGDRTRDIDGAHIEFLSGIENPIGIKIGPSISGEELIEVINLICVSQK